MSAKSKPTVQDRFSLRLMVKEDLDPVLRMRNNPNTRRYMKDSSIISRDEHKSWFERKSVDSSTKLLVFLCNDDIVGFAQFIIIEDSKTAEWGFYKANEAGRGIGLKLGLSVIDYIFSETNVVKIIGEVLEPNIVSIQFHRKLGFIQESVLVKNQFYHGNYINTVRFALYKSVSA